MRATVDIKEYARPHSRYKRNGVCKTPRVPELLNTLHTRLVPSPCKTPRVPKLIIIIVVVVTVVAIIAVIAVKL